jgi:capsid protein
MNAQIKGVENGVLSLQDVASHYGRDIEEVFEAHERERELADRFGIKLAFQPFGAKRPAEPIVE